MNRREFFEKLAATGLFGSAAMRARGGGPPPQDVDLKNPSPDPYWPPDTGSEALGSMAESSSIPRITNPNILVIVVDQMRYPVWLTPDQVTMLETTVAPTIFGPSIRKNSVVFKQFFTASNRCSPARGTMLTGLYSHQTYLMAANNNESSPYLRPGFWTYGHALPQVNSAYTDKVYWFGKWHASLYDRESSIPPIPLSPWGFKMHPFHEGLWHPSKYLLDPYGWANEGAKGGNNSNDGGPQGRSWNQYVADEDIATNFEQWLTEAQPASGWCATVSFINPHDISFYPGYFRPDWAFPPPWPGEEDPGPFSVTFPVYYDPPPDTPPGVQGADPFPWNNADNLAVKPSFQTQFRDFLDNMNHAVPDWAKFLDYYWYMHQYVDAQVKRVLDAVPPAEMAKTIIVFTSDHGEYAGSHGLRGKGGAAYDEGIRVPLFVKFPGGQGLLRTQMCSTVDLLPFLCDLATDGGNWRTQHPNLAVNYANRESIWNFIHNPLTTPQRRVIAALNQPYILHTTDEEFTADVVPNARYEIDWRNHVVCLRTNSEIHPLGYAVGGKLAHYYRWRCDSDLPVTPYEVDKEFYKYESNRQETNNDWSSSDPLVQQYETALGTFGGAGLIESELRAPLSGVGPTNQSLQDVVRPAARQHYLNFRAGVVCAP